MVYHWLNASITQSQGAVEIKDFRGEGVASTSSHGLPRERLQQKP
jgi:hypothetical protein